MKKYRCFLCNKREESRDIPADWLFSCEDSNYAWGYGKGREGYICGTCLNALCGHVLRFKDDEVTVGFIGPDGNFTTDTSVSVYDMNARLKNSAIKTKDGKVYTNWYWDISEPVAVVLEIAHDHDHEHDHSNCRHGH